MIVSKRNWINCYPQQIRLGLKKPLSFVFAIFSIPLMEKDGTEFYIIEMPFEPRVNYDDYYESEEEYYANNPNSPKLQML